MIKFTGFSSSNNNSLDKDTFGRIRISIATPEKILADSYGEVKKPETINYRTSKPEKDGLCCSKIFGPVKDYECWCGKYKRAKYRGIVCENCGVEITHSSVRRDRMGHITLAYPVVHTWFLRSLPSRIGLLLGVQLKYLESVVYFDSFVVIDPGCTPLEKYMFLKDECYYKALAEYGEDSFVADTGAFAIMELLKSLNLKDLRKKLQDEIANTSSEIKQKKLVKRCRLIDNFINSNTNPANMVMTCIPVLPPDLRPLVMTDGGKIASSDFNELYRVIVNRNNRLLRLKELRAPDVVLRNEKRMLQESVDALFDNSKKNRVARGSTRRPLKSLSDSLKGKRGRFRQNLLGKRVDYSGRSVIVVGPKLKLHQCGIPKVMALELFKPFIYHDLMRLGLAATIKIAKRMIVNGRSEVWDVLDSVTRSHPVLLNRAPTLHRLGIQAFEPVLIEGKAIQLHPLVCSAFNADFDGDQMAVHIPISIEAQMEARVLMMSTNNILSPSSGKPVIVPSKDIVLGLYYLSILKEEDEENSDDGYEKASFMDKTVFASEAEVEHALDAKIIRLHQRINYRAKYYDEELNLFHKRVVTTPGRVLISQVLPKSDKVTFDLVNRILNAKIVTSLVDDVYRKCGQFHTVEFVDKLMQLGFKYATVSGVSYGKSDMLVPHTKQKHVLKSKSVVKELEEQYSRGLITLNERDNKVIDEWSNCTELVADDMMLAISGKLESSKDIKDSVKYCTKYRNSIYMMVDSGARGSQAQVRQLAGMRGLISKASGEIIASAIISNFKEGLNVLEYFNSAHGARKGLADTALKTADSGYLTRRLVDVSQDSVIMEYDCGSKEGLLLNPLPMVGGSMGDIKDILVGRSAVEDVYNPVTGELILKSTELIDEVSMKQFNVAGDCKY